MLGRDTFRSRIQDLKGFQVERAPRTRKAWTVKVAAQGTYEEGVQEKEETSYKENEMKKKK